MAQTDEKIRQRKSYQMFDEVRKAFAEDTEKGLETLYSKLDNMHAFGTRTQSEYARESLNLLKKDLQNVLSQRTKELILRGGKVCGSFKEGYFYIEEELYTDEAEEVHKFCTWLDDEVGGAGHGNIDFLFNAFKNPDDAKLQKEVEAVKRMIASFKVK